MIPPNLPDSTVFAEIPLRVADPAMFVNGFARDAKVASPAPNLQQKTLDQAVPGWRRVNGFLRRWADALASGQCQAIKRVRAGKR
jgi:hypothetical protein